MYICMWVPATFILRCMSQARAVFRSCICVWGFLPLFYEDVCAKPGQCSGHVYVYEGSCYYFITMYVPRQDSVRVMYMCMRVSAIIILSCVCQARTMFGSCICASGFPPLFYYHVCATRGQYAGHVYVYEDSCHYSIKMYVPVQDNVWVMYMCMRVSATILLNVCAPRQDSVRVMCMCMRVPATIILRCMCPAPGYWSIHVYVYEGSCHYSIKMYVPPSRTEFESCICVWWALILALFLQVFCYILELFWRCCLFLFLFYSSHQSDLKRDHGWWQCKLTWSEYHS